MANDHTQTYYRKDLKGQKPLMVIEPPRGWLSIGLKELWSYRELAYYFVWRDIKVRYKQTAIGALWAIFQPLFAMIIFTVFFGKLAKIPSDGVPYPIFVYVGLLLWNYFSFGLSHAGGSVVSNAGMIQKIYFPRLIIPISSSLVGLVDFICGSVVLILLMIMYGYKPHFTGIIYIPILLFITFLSSVGIGCFLASLNVKYRDVQYIIPFFIQMFMFLTPVIYPMSMVGKKYRFIMDLNPMATVIENARGVILGVRGIDWNLMSMAIFVSACLFIAGVMYFRKTEKYFADII